MDETTNTKMQDIQREIISLRASLSADVSDIGDYKIVKCMEAKLKDEDMPYDIDDLITQRQAVRDKINELQTQAQELEEENSKAVAD